MPSGPFGRVIREPASKATKTPETTLTGWNKRFIVVVPLPTVLFGYCAHRDPSDIARAQAPAIRARLQASATTGRLLPRRATARMSMASENTAGTRKSVNRVDTARPPTTTLPSPR